MVRRLVLCSMLLVSAGAVAAEPCGLCATAVVTNSDLATCFLERYEELSAAGTGAVAVDLTECESSRGVVLALPAPNFAPAEPDLQFLVTRPQLDCLKAKLEEPGLVLDPSARIALDAC